MVILSNCGLSMKLERSLIIGRSVTVTNCFSSFLVIHGKLLIPKITCFIKSTSVEMWILPSVEYQVLFVCTTWRQTAFIPWVSKTTLKLLDVQDPNFAKMTLCIYSCLYNYICLWYIIYILCFIGVKSGNNLNFQFETRWGYSHLADTMQSLWRIMHVCVYWYRRMFSTWICLLMFFLNPVFTFLPLSPHFL